MPVPGLVRARILISSAMLALGLNVSSEALRRGENPFTPELLEELRER